MLGKPGKEDDARTITDTFQVDLEAMKEYHPCWATWQTWSPAPTSASCWSCRPVLNTCTIKHGALISRSGGEGLRP